MPVTIKSGSIKYKDPTTGEYTAIDVIGQKITYDAEAYAIGRRGGKAVSSNDAAWQNNSLYYSQQAAAYARQAQQAAQGDFSEINSAITQIQQKLKKKIDDVKLVGLRLEFYSQNSLVAYCELADNSITYNKLAKSLQNAISKIDTAMTADVYDPLGLGKGETGKDPYTYAAEEDTKIKNQIVSTDTYRIDGTDYTGLNAAFSGILTKAKSYLTDTYTIDETEYQGLVSALNGVLDKAIAYDAALRQQIVIDDIYTIEGTDCKGLVNALLAVLEKANNHSDAMLTRSYLVDETSYNGLVPALEGVLSKAKTYIDNKITTELNAYQPYAVTIVDQLPETGADRTFYLIKNDDGTYQKWWYIDGEEDQETTGEQGSQTTPKKKKIWDQFKGGSSTKVVEALPADKDANEDIDYILKTDSGGCMYYKWVDGQWKIVAGSLASIVDSLPVDEEGHPKGNEFTDYYVVNKETVDNKQVVTGYTHYKFNNGAFIPVGNNISMSTIESVINSKINTYNTNTIAPLAGTVSNLQSKITGPDGIEQQLSKIQDIARYELQREDTDENNYIISLIEKIDSVQNERYQVYIPKGGTGGGGQSTSATDKLTLTKVGPYADTSSIVCSNGDLITLQWELDAKTEDGVPLTDCQYDLRLGNNIIASGQNVSPGLLSFSVQNYYRVGTNVFSLYVFNSERTSRATSYYTVDVKNLRITSDFADNVVYSTSENIVFSCQVTTNVAPTTVHFKLDGVELTPVIMNQVATSTITCTIPAQTHGIHNIESWATASTSGINIESQEHIYRNIICYNYELNTPILGSIYDKNLYGVVGENDGKIIYQYDMIGIPYYVYDIKMSALRITLIEIVDGQQQVIDTLRVENMNNTWNYSNGTPGLHKLKIRCSNGTHTVQTQIHLNVTQLNANIAPVSDNNLMFDFNPVGYSNTSDDIITNKVAWRYQKQGQAELQLSLLDNFDLTKGGYGVDPQGGSYFCIKAGSRAKLNYKLFAPSNTNNGAEFKIIFKTERVKNPDAIFLDCLKNVSDNKQVGLSMKAHESVLTTQEGDLTLSYSQEDIIEFEYNIQKIETAQDGTQQGFILTYEDGVANRALAYKQTASVAQISQNLGDIILGSDDCDLYIYRMRAYNRALSSEEILKNFIADGRTPANMIQRYTRNISVHTSLDQIPDNVDPYTYFADELDPYRVADACPDLKIIIIKAPHFTNDKGDFVENTEVTCIHRNGRADEDNWVMGNGFHAGQGTSSNKYGLAGRNIDIIFGFDGQDIVNGDIYEQWGNQVKPDYRSWVQKSGKAQEMNEPGVKRAKVTLTENSVPNDWFNIKVNIASSDNTNNAYLQGRYNRFLPYESPAKKRDPRIKNAMEFVNCVIFIQETDETLETDSSGATVYRNPVTGAITTQENGGKPVYINHREFNDTNAHFYGIGNIGDSKKTDNTRVNDPTDENEFVIEISDNYLPNSGFSSGVYQKTVNDKGETLSVTYDIDESPTRVAVYPITEEQWSTYESGDNGYQPVTEDIFLIDKNKEYLYIRTSDGRYVQMNENDNFQSGVTYYKIKYRNEKYNRLHSKFKYIRQQQDPYTGKMKDKVRDWSGWDASFEFRYDPGSKDGVEIPGIEVDRESNRDVFRKFYEFVIMSSKDNFYSHLKDWFIQESALYWYLFTERYTMIDSRAKNTFWHYGRVYITEAQKATMEAENPGSSEIYTVNEDAATRPFISLAGAKEKYNTNEDSTARQLAKADGYVVDDAKLKFNGYRFEFFAYDMDTALGIDNNGVMTRPPGLQDIDTMPSGDPAFNEGDSLFFRRIRESFYRELSAMHKQLAARNCWSAQDLIEEFDKKQEQFPEELWRLDIERKYIRPATTGNWLAQFYKQPQKSDSYLQEMMNGRKRYQRRQFERVQEMYIDTKYQGPVYSGVNSSIYFQCRVKAGEQSADKVYVTPYYPMYVNVAYGNSNDMLNQWTQYRASASGQTIEVPAHDNAGNDTRLYILCGQNITSLGDLSRFYIYYNDFSMGKRLRTLQIGSSDTNFENSLLTSVNISGCVLLQELDITNCTNLQGVLDVSGCSNLKIIKANNTKLSSITVPDNGQLVQAYLPKTTNLLNFRNLHYLTTLEVQHDPNTQYQNLGYLYIKNTNNIDPVGIATAALQNMFLTDDNQRIPVLRETRIEGLELTRKVKNGDTETLTNVYVTNDFLKRIYEQNKSDTGQYLDPSNWVSVLSGQAYLDGTIGEDEITGLQDYVIETEDGSIPVQRASSVLWPDLMLYLTDAEAQIQPMVSVKFVNSDQTVLYTYKAVYKTNPRDPVFYGEIPTPTKAPTIQKAYIFGDPNHSSYEAWDGWYLCIKDGNNYIPNTNTTAAQIKRMTLTDPETVFMAKYTETVRQYTIKWYSFNGIDAKLLDERQARYGYGATYQGEWPTDTSGQNAGIFRIFTGWDKNTAEIFSDMNVYAQWQTVNSRTDAISGKLHELTPVQIYATTKENNQGRWEVPANLPSGSPPYTDITLGHDFNFSNVTTHQLGKDSDFLLYNAVSIDGEGGFHNYYYSGLKLYEDELVGDITNMHLFGPDAPSFTLAIDFQFGSSFGASEETLVSSYYEGDPTEFRIYRDGNRNVRLEWGNAKSSYKSGQQTSQAYIIGQKNQRDIVVIRHKKGSQELNVYSSYDYADSYNFVNNGQNSHAASNYRQYSGYEGRLNYVVPERQVETLVNTGYNPSTSKDRGLTFGGLYNQAGNIYNTSKICHATIYWCKIWDADIGEENAKMLASWPRETLRMEYCGQRAKDTRGIRTKGTWISNSILGGCTGRYVYWNTYSSSTHTIWPNNPFRKIFNERLIYSFPVAWQSIITPVQLNYIRGQNTTVNTSDVVDKLYLPCIYDMGLPTGLSGSQLQSYQGEAGDKIQKDGELIYLPPISHLNESAERFKFRGITRKYTVTSNFYDNNTNTSPPISTADYSLVSGDILKEGDIGHFIYSNQTWRYYMFLSEATVNRYGLKNFENNTGTSSNSYSSYNFDYPFCIKVDNNGNPGYWIPAWGWITRSPSYGGNTNPYGLYGISQNGDTFNLYNYYSNYMNYFVIAFSI